MYILKLFKLFQTLFPHISGNILAELMPSTIPLVGSLPAAYAISLANSLAMHLLSYFMF